MPAPTASRTTAQRSAVRNSRRAQRRPRWGRPCACAAPAHGPCGACARRRQAQRAAHGQLMRAGGRATERAGLFRSAWRVQGSAPMDLATSCSWFSQPRWRRRCSARLPSCITLQRRQAGAGRAASWRRARAAAPGDALSAALQSCQSGPSLSCSATWMHPEAGGSAATPPPRPWCRASDGFLDPHRSATRRSLRRAMAQQTACDGLRPQRRHQWRLGACATPPAVRQSLDSVLSRFRSCMERRTSARLPSDCCASRRPSRRTARRP